MNYEFKFPDVGEGIHEGKIVKWLVKEGDKVKADDSLAEIETDKAIVEIPSPKAGKISKITHAEGDTIQVGEILVTLELAAGENATDTEKTKESTGVVGALEETATGILKAPSPEQSGAVFGQGETKGEAPSTQKKEEPPNAPIPVKPEAKPAEKTGTLNVVKSEFKAVKKYDMFGYIDRVPYDGVRKIVGEHMVKSMFTIPHVTHTDIADVTKLFDIRKTEKVKAEKEGIKLTFLPYFIKAVVAGLKQHPHLNASLDEEASKIILKKYFNIGIAVDTEVGLMVPVIKGADNKSIYELAKEIAELAEKARSRKINSMDFKGGTFTITNIGSAGSGWFATPIINYPEAAILGTGMIQDSPLAIDGKVEIRKVLPLSLAFDHRVLDGAEAALFVKAVKEQLEAPEKL